MGKIPLSIGGFTADHAKDKELVLRMLRYENEYGLSEEGTSIYKSELFDPHTLFPIYVTHRHVLSFFGFDTSDESVANYRTIFSNFYESPTVYDKDVINSVFYMKQNKCMFYTRPKPKIGDVLIDSQLTCLDGRTKIMLSAILSDALHSCKYFFVCSFSSS